MGAILPLKHWNASYKCPNIELLYKFGWKSGAFRLHSFPFYKYTWIKSFDFGELYVRVSVCVCIHKTAIYQAIISLVRCVAMLCSIMCLETKMQRFALSFKCCHTEKKNQTQQSGTCSYHTFYGPPPIFLLLLPHQKPKICLNINIYESKICLDGEANRNGDKKNILLVCCTCILCRYSFPNLLYTLLNTLKLWLDDNIFFNNFRTSFSIFWL